MPEVGYWLSSEEHGPRALVEHAVRAEAAGFRRAMISDHLHPWTPTQGHSPFVWGVLGAIVSTRRLAILPSKFTYTTYIKLTCGAYVGYFIYAPYIR